jgi:hypothetical protein
MPKNVAIRPMLGAHYSQGWFGFPESCACHRLKALILSAHRMFIHAEMSFTFRASVIAKAAQIGSSGAASGHPAQRWRRRS